MRQKQETNLVAAVFEVEVGTVPVALFSSTQLKRTRSMDECWMQLVEMGYFPCAPIRPTLAVDINLLEFVSIASHHMAPNVTGWSSTLQHFLSIRGYLVGEDTGD